MRMTWGRSLSLGLGVVSLGLLSGGAWAQIIEGSTPPSATQWHPTSSLQKPADIGFNAHTNIVGLILPKANVTPPKPASGSGVSPNAAPYSGYNYETPSSLACVYRLVAQTTGCNPANAAAIVTGGAGLAIAIVDAFDSPGIQADLAKFDTQFNLPAPPGGLQVVYASGKQPSADSGWAFESSLDVEWAHAMSPNAKLYLVEAASNSFTDLLIAVDTASRLVHEAGGGVVSMSWGGSEFYGQTSFDKFFQKPSVTYLAASGDYAGVLYPSSSAYVVAVGGSSLSRDSAGNFTGEFAWPSAGSGLSAYVARPRFQYSVSNIVGRSRGVPDIASDADPSTGVWVTYNNAWYIAGGTSVATAVEAGIFSHNGDKYFLPQGALDSIYNGRFGNFRDITSGHCGPNNGYSAGSGWDLCTGWGSLLGGGSRLFTAGVTR